MSDWQSIETAPKGGAEFLGYDIHTKRMDVCSMENISTTEPLWVCRATSWNWDYDDHPDFTHWMPLPAPPSPK